ncbi:MAG TPA: helix-turn-helix domain-containing protein [Candidatus Acidoferrum sp.]|nr:helix-turn-helix domain-containing protein [Candidatus Acidoferrum sp.]
MAVTHKPEGMAADASIVDQLRELATRALARVQRGSEIKPRLLDVDDSARYMSMSDKGIRELIVAGEIGYIQKVPGRSPYLIDIRDLDDWILKNKVRAGA